MRSHLHTTRGHLRRRIPVIAAISVITVGMSAIGASAHEDDAADATAQVITEVAPSIDIEPVTAERDGGFTAAVDGGTVAIPSAASDPVEVALATGAPVGDSLESLDITLPVMETESAAAATDGTVVFDGDHTDLAVQATSDGIRLQTVLNDASAPTEFSYTFGEGVLPVLNADGSVSLTVAGTSADVTVAVGQVDAPWAFDANGSALPTSYRVEGAELIQVIPHASSTIVYPVVADPSVTIGWRIYVRYSVAETKAQTVGWRGTVNEKGKYAAALCAALVVGGAIGAVAAAACAFATYDVSSSIMATAKTAASQKRGMEIQYNYIEGVYPVAWKVI